MKGTAESLDESILRFAAPDNSTLWGKPVPWISAETRLRSRYTQYCASTGNDQHILKSGQFCACMSNQTKGPQSRDLCEASGDIGRPTCLWPSWKCGQRCLDKRKLHLVISMPWIVDCTASNLFESMERQAA